MTFATRSRGGRGESSVALVSDAGDADPCTSRLADADVALAILFDHRPREWLADCGALATPVEFVATYPHPDCVRVLSDRGDLSTVALAVDRFLDSLADDETPAVCIDALAPVLHYATPPAVARFVSVLAGRVRAAGGTLHCHADADTVDALPRAGVLFDGSLAADAADTASAVDTASTADTDD